MADDHSQRPYRTPDNTGRNRSASGSDPLSELARLIGQSDPFAEFGRDTGRHAPPAPGAPAGDRTAPAAAVPGYAPRVRRADEPPHPAAAPYAAEHYAADDLYHTEAGGFPPRAEAGGYEQAHEDAGTAPYGPEDHDFYEDVQPRRRMGVLAIAAVFALAVIGTAGAFGYRALFGSNPSGPPPVIKADTAPSKIVAAKKEFERQADPGPRPARRETRRARRKAGRYPGQASRRVPAESGERRARGGAAGARQRRGRRRSEEDSHHHHPSRSAGNGGRSGSRGGGTTASGG